MSDLPLRVTFDHQIFAMQSYGGISRYFCEIASRMQNDPALLVRVVAPLYVNHYLRESRVSKIGTYVPAISRTHRVRAGLANFAARALMPFTRPDVVHQTFYARHPIVPKRAKLVITVHDMIHERMPELFPPHDRTRERKERAVRAADHIICVSEYTRGELIDILGVPREKTTVVHHGCHLQSRPTRPAESRARPFILYVGARDGYKNFESVLRALRHSSALSRSLDLVAFGGPAWGEKDVATVRRAGLRQSQVRHCYGSDEDLAHLYSVAEALILPSVAEGFGLPILEAMSLGCPVICSNTSSLPEVAADAAQYFDPRDISSIATAAEAVAGNPRRRQELAQLGLCRVRSFSWDTAAAKTRDVYIKTRAAPAT